MKHELLLAPLNSHHAFCAVDGLILRAVFGLGFGIEIATLSIGPNNGPITYE